MQRFGYESALRPVAPCTLVLLLATLGVFLLQAILRGAGADILTGFFGLSVSGFLRGHFWTLLSYLFLHGGVFHLLVNMLMLYMLGSEVEERVGRLHYLILYFMSGALGGLGWLGLTWPYEGLCVGASGAIFGLLGAFAVLYPHREITVLVFFIIPITMRAWVLGAVLGLIQFLMMIAPASGSIAYSAHLAGGLAGAIYIGVLFRPEAIRDWWRARQSAVQAHRQARTRQVNEVQRAEVDRLLDKMAAQGLHSLTAAERKTLEKASSALRKT